MYLYSIIMNDAIANNKLLFSLAQNHLGSVSKGFSESQYGASKSYKIKI